MNNQLQQICLDKAQQMASEINGDLYYVPQEDIDQLLSKLTEDNVDDIAEELAELAHWFNWTHDCICNTQEQESTESFL